MTTRQGDPRSDYIFGDLLQSCSDGCAVAVFIEYLPDDRMYDARLLSKHDKETFCTANIEDWRPANESI